MKKLPPLPKRGRPPGRVTNTVTLNCRLRPEIKAYLGPNYSQAITRLVEAQPDFRKPV